ncbi:hypothetical protein F5X96DRAFT_500364 [Biscogniauxia mediterranea]|nr:hypothetical protein F5X96DRAFT_500364 [Biscogniauxia mediterranea]
MVSCTCGRFFLVSLFPFPLSLLLSSFPAGRKAKSKSGEEEGQKKKTQLERETERERETSRNRSHSISFSETSGKVRQTIKKKI